jgi:acyl-CoA oxidase
MVSSWQRRIGAVSQHVAVSDASGSRSEAGRPPCTKYFENVDKHEIPEGNHIISQLSLEPTRGSAGAQGELSRELQGILDHDCPDERAKLKSIMASDHMFLPKWNISMEEERELALARLRVLCESGTFSIKDFRTNPLRIFAAHECAALADVSMATKMTVQFNLFGGTVLKLGTKKHHDLLLAGIDSLLDVGCFGLTELGFGNNAVCMETVATYDKERDEFVIQSTTPLAQKYWITNGAIHAHWAVVFAQMMVDGTNHGIHGFLVPIRDHRSMLPKPGVTIHDMGHKMGCNGVDNAKLSFQGTWVKSASGNVFPKMVNNAGFIIFLCRC